MSIARASTLAGGRGAVDLPGDELQARVVEAAAALFVSVTQQVRSAAVSSGRSTAT
jgi:hypothetical protein